MSLRPEITQHYQRGDEICRLQWGTSQIEGARTQELLARFLPKPPACVLDVGGGPGIYSLWLVELGYEVHLVDPVRLHLEQAAGLARQQGRVLASIREGDARALDQPDASVDAVLMLGPLYHLIEREDRFRAWCEAARVVRPGGIVVAIGISRFASLLDGIKQGFLDDPDFAAIVERDLAEGQHRNPTLHPYYFTTAYFHEPGELAEEARAAGLQAVRTLGVEGPGWLVQDFAERWQDPEHRRQLLDAARRVEEEPSLLGTSAHLLAVGRRP